MALDDDCCRSRPSRVPRFAAGESWHFVALSALFMKSDPASPTLNEAVFDAHRGCGAYFTQSESPEPAKSVAKCDSWIWPFLANCWEAPFKRFCSAAAPTHI
jgi:hypothetical protein